MIRLVLPFLALLFSAGSFHRAAAAPVTMQGTVYYRERIALPSDAQVEAVIFEVPPRGSGSRIFARGEERMRMDVPHIYRVAYDDAQIRPDMRYVMEIRIHTPDGRTLFVTPSPLQLFSSNAPNRDRVLLHSAGNKPLERTGSRKTLGLYGAWLVEDIRGGGVIDRVQAVLQLDINGAVSGSGGCNSMTGMAQIRGDVISFGPIASTRMACAAAAMDQEQKFFTALSAVKSWRVEVPTRKLFLLDDQNNPLIVLSRI